MNMLSIVFTATFLVSNALSAPISRGNFDKQQQAVANNNKEFVCLGYSKETTYERCTPDISFTSISALLAAFPAPKTVFISGYSQNVLSLDLITNNFQSEVVFRSAETQKQKINVNLKSASKIAFQFIDLTIANQGEIVLSSLETLNCQIKNLNPTNTLKITVSGKCELTDTAINDNTIIEMNYLASKDGFSGNFQLNSNSNVGIVLPNTVNEIKFSLGFVSFFYLDNGNRKEQIVNYDQLSTGTFIKYIINSDFTENVIKITRNNSIYQSPDSSLYMTKIETRTGNAVNQLSFVLDDRWIGYANNFDQLEVFKFEFIFGQTTNKVKIQKSSLQAEIYSIFDSSSNNYLIESVDQDNTKYICLKNPNSLTEDLQTKCSPANEVTTLDGLISKIDQTKVNYVFVYGYTSSDDSLIINYGSLTNADILDYCTFKAGQGKIQMVTLMLKASINSISLEGFWAEVQSTADVTFSGKVSLINCNLFVGNDFLSNKLTQKTVNLNCLGEIDIYNLNIRDNCYLRLKDSTDYNKFVSQIEIGSNGAIGVVVPSETSTFIICQDRIDIFQESIKISSIAYPESGIAKVIYEGSNKINLIRDYSIQNDQSETNFNSLIVESGKSSQIYSFDNNWIGFTGKIQFSTKNNEITGTKIQIPNLMDGDKIPYKVIEGSSSISKEVIENSYINNNKVLCLVKSKTTTNSYACKNDADIFDSIDKLAKSVQTENKIPEMILVYGYSSNSDLISLDYTSKIAEFAFLLGDGGLTFKSGEDSRQNVEIKLKESTNSLAFYGFNILMINDINTTIQSRFELINCNIRCLVAKYGIRIMYLSSVSSNKKLNLYGNIIDHGIYIHFNTISDFQTGSRYNTITNKGHAGLTIPEDCNLLVFGHGYIEIFKENLVDNSKELYLSESLSFSENDFIYLLFNHQTNKKIEIKPDNTLEEGDPTLNKVVILSGKDDLLFYYGIDWTGYSSLNDLNQYKRTFFIRDYSSSSSSSVLSSSLSVIQSNWFVKSAPFYVPLPNQFVNHKLDVCIVKEGTDISDISSDCIIINKYGDSELKSAINVNRQIRIDFIGYNADSYTIDSLSTEYDIEFSCQYLKTLNLLNVDVKNKALKFLNGNIINLTPKLNTEDKSKNNQNVYIIPIKELSLDNSNLFGLTAATDQKFVLVPKKESTDSKNGINRANFVANVAIKDVGIVVSTVDSIRSVIVDEQINQIKGKSNLIFSLSPTNVTIKSTGIVLLKEKSEETYEFEVPFSLLSDLSIFTLEVSSIVTITFSRDPTFTNEMNSLLNKFKISPSLLDKSQSAGAVLKFDSTWKGFVSSTESSSSFIGIVEDNGCFEKSNISNFDIEFYNGTNVIPKENRPINTETCFYDFDHVKNNDNGKKDPPLSPGAIAGIVIGAIVVVFVVIGLIIYFAVYKKKAYMLKKGSSEELNNGSENI